MSKIHTVYEHKNIVLKEYIPSLFKPMSIVFNKLTISRRIRLFIAYCGKLSYRVYYLFINDEPVGYCIVEPGKRRLKCTEIHDIVIGPYYIEKNYRGNNYGELLIKLVLKYTNYQYKKAYDYIKKSNVPSIKTTEKCGFKRYGYGRSILKQIVKSPDGEYVIYMKEKDNSEGVDKI